MCTVHTRNALGKCAWLRGNIIAYPLPLDYVLLNSLRVYTRFYDLKRKNCAKIPSSDRSDGKWNRKIDVKPIYLVCMPYESKYEYSIVSFLLAILKSWQDDKRARCVPYNSEQERWKTGFGFHSIVIPWWEPDWPSLTVCFCEYVCCNIQIIARLFIRSFFVVRCAPLYVGFTCADLRESNINNYWLHISCSSRFEYGMFMYGVCWCNRNCLLSKLLRERLIIIWIFLNIFLAWSQLQLQLFWCTSNRYFCIIERNFGSTNHAMYWFRPKSITTFEVSEKWIIVVSLLNALGHSGIS